MSGYVASARIAGPMPRLVRRARPVEEADSSPAVVLAVEPVVEPDAADGVDERWVAFRERWSQLTFFLFDPNSWR